MKVHDEKPDGWSKVARRIKRAEEPVPLSEIQLARIGRRVFHAKPLPRRRAWLAVPALLLACALLFWGVRSRPIANTAASPVAPAPHLLEPARLAVLDSGITVPLSEGRAIVRDGRVAIRTGDQPLTIEVPKARVQLLPHALVELDVKQLHLRIAAYRGEATLTTSSFTLTIPAGRSATETGAVALAEDRADILDAALDGRAPHTHEMAQPMTSALALPAPAPRPRPTHQPAPETHRRMVVATTAPTAPAILPSPALPPLPGLGAESELVAASLAKLNLHDAAGALALADEHAMRFPAGPLSGEAALVRAQALAQLGRRTEALVALNQAQSHDAGPAARIALVRGELRAAGGDCSSALVEFDAVLSGSDAELLPRARFDRGVCRAKLGDREGAREDLKKYLATQPTGPNAATARRALGE
jgi:hypothetical protein